MNDDPFPRICSYFDERDVPYTLHEHDPVITSDEAKEVKVSDALGVKSLLFRTENGRVLLVLAGDRKVSSKKARKELGVRDIRMVSPDEVLSVMGCEVGGCYPVGPVCGVPMILDHSVTEADALLFNAGRRDRSLEMNFSDFKKAVPFESADISEPRS